MRLRTLLLAPCATLTGWIAWDLTRSPSGDLRRFDPRETGRIEADMWRSYYERRPLALFSQLTGMLRSQYHLPFWRSVATGYHATRAAFVFKDGKSRAGYEKALPDLNRYFTAIAPPGVSVAEAARLELEWWIIHRQRAQYGEDALAEALAKLQEHPYQVPAARFADHAKLRADAMLRRDRAAEGTGMNEEEWRRIRELLEASWTSLWREVRH